MWQKLKKTTGPLIVILVLLVTTAIALYVVWWLDSSPRTDDAYAYADTISVTAEVSGRIIDLPVRDNQLVKKGDLLFRIDPQPFELTLAKARAALTALEKEIGLMERSIAAQEYGAQAAQNQVETASAARKQARATLDRLEPLLQEGFVSAEQVDLARTALAQAETQEAAAIAAAKSAEAAVTGVDALIAQIAVLKVEIAMAELQLEYTVVRAPCDGRISGLHTTAGQFTAAGHPVFTLINTENWYILANFRETDFRHIRRGAAATVYLMSDTGKKFSAVIDSSSYGVYPDDGGLTLNGLPVVKRSINWVRVAQRFPVKFKVNDPDGELFRIGASAIVVIDKQPAE